MCPWTYQALLTVCSVAAVKATPWLVSAVDNLFWGWRRGDRTQFSFHILMGGMAIRQDVIGFGGDSYSRKRIQPQ